MNNNIQFRNMNLAHKQLTSIFELENLQQDDELNLLDSSGNWPKDAESNNQDYSEMNESRAMTRFELMRLQSQLPDGIKNKFVTKRNLRIKRQANSQRESHKRLCNNT